MKNISIVPADTYTVINKSIITERDKKIVLMLYQPIVGYVATSLYYSLISDLDERELMSEDLTHHHLMATMQLRLDDIVIAREKLEACGLLKTYLKKGNLNQYVYLIYSPIDASEFFNHPILNVVLYNNIGKKEYDRRLNYFKIPDTNLSDYVDITASFDDVFTPVEKSAREEEKDITKKDSNNILLHKGVDFNLIISSIPEKEVNENCFNNEVRDFINNLSFVYNLNTLDMQGLIRESINERGLIDRELLRKNCSEYYKFENAGKLPTVIYNKQPEFLKKKSKEEDSSKWDKMVYTFENLTPYQLLKAKYNGAEPTNRDKKLIERLLIDQKLNPGVVNVLISYVLKTNHEQLKKSYVETIAGQWKRANVQTVEEAMRMAEDYHKKMKKIQEDKKRREQQKSRMEPQQLPIWFDEEQSIVNTSQEDVEELSKLLSDLG